MKKRYQVFVSSTYLDLKDERWEVMKALLEQSCIPSGMELFPAADDDQWSFIKRVIDDCDYYVLLLGGRYGSISPTTDKSYTHMEYEYAIEQGKPVVAFLYDNPDDLPASRSEKTDDGRRRLEEFRKLVQTKLCSKWSSAGQLSGLVSRSLVRLMEDKPAVGWVRADQVNDELHSREVETLRKKVKELEERDSRKATGKGLNAEELAHGREPFYMKYSYSEVQYDQEDEESDIRWKNRTTTIVMSWEEVFTTLVPSILKATPEEAVREAVDQLVFRRKPNWRLRLRWGIDKVHLTEDDFQTLKAQMRGLGLIQITQSEEPFQIFWRLTDKGDEYMLQAKTIRTKSNTNSS